MLTLLAWNIQIQISMAVLTAEILMRLPKSTLSVWILILKKATKEYMKKNSTANNSGEKCP